ncbi:hypothetical protein CP97_09045 [Aurantiacibacter atlanticus]|uniref:Uncharacterized protein n=1 Tax=Aurantiacibacter atlanticus TaxID=1648404 RepID=A0A0H4VBV2_9SPHN|nr:hypothetical protein [Aurantiacibacter atlanticus]AKQ42132.1 hypothetical protein CP97_09045 [Aurantiacibacter atlanticus]MDF1834181.1 hypothetical protein [Alteraurantiacibacter sp. bin_em_oilr2.035]
MVIAAWPIDGLTALARSPGILSKCDEETGYCRKVSKRLMFLLTVTGLAMLLLLVVAWFDGGQEEQRLIVEPVSVPEVSL